jgi:hypothetical protein
VIRDDEASLLQSLSSFEALGLEWYADETRRLLAGSRPGS